MSQTMLLKMRTSPQRKHDWRSHTKHYVKYILMRSFSSSVFSRIWINAMSYKSSEAQFGPPQNSKMETFKTIVNSWKPLAILFSIFDVSRCPGCASDLFINWKNDKIWHGKSSTEMFLPVKTWHHWYQRCNLIGNVALQ